MFDFTQIQSYDRYHRRLFPVDNHNDILDGNNTIICNDFWFPNFKKYKNLTYFGFMICN